ncbi:HNH endonuclease [Treponema sp.]|uniref:HNH endonuclease n=1 Tax=Treponema sp. TaxID=166 RepID=UPI0025FF2E43|nr:HNH endonuclease [Treponema sp.]
MIVKQCSVPNCNEYCVPGSSFCAKHKAESDKRRAARKPFENAKRTADYSNPAWRKLKTVLLKDAYCAYCGSRENLQVHHIKPVREHPELFLVKENCMVLCRSCHAVVTAREVHGRKKANR